MSESSSNLDQILAALQHLQHENANLRNFVPELQAATTVRPHPIIDPSVVEPNVSLPDKFDGMRSRLTGFINQIRLIIRLQPQCYSDDFRRVGVIGMLLTGQAQASFAPLTSSPLLTDFEEFLTDFIATFREIYKRRAALNKLYALQQGQRAASIYASEFRQLACDVEWDGPEEDVPTIHQEDNKNQQKKY